MTVKLHRALTLVVMILISVALLAAMTAYGVAVFGRSTIPALGIVVVIAAVAGVGFSFRRYFPKRS
jgi:peptidoglycan/LPS O-acetylase OafA/YrhL